MSANALTTGVRSGILTLQPKKTATGFGSPIQKRTRSAPSFGLAAFLCPKFSVLLYLAWAALDAGASARRLLLAGLPTHPVPPFLFGSMGRVKFIRVRRMP